MNKKSFGKFGAIGAGALLTVLLASCQVSPVNGNTVITNADGAGNKTLSLFCLVDGSIQIQPDTESFVGNNSYFHIEDMKNPTFTPKADNWVKYISDGYFTNPNHLTTPTEIWDEWNAKVASIIPEGFEFSMDTFKSAGWKDEMMNTTVAGFNTTNEWKAFVYNISYSWNNVEEYKTKTKALIGETNFAVSEMADLEDANTPWVSFEKGEEADGMAAYTWKECYTVNYWSCFGLVDAMLSSNLFNRDALGADYHVDTSSAISMSQQSYKIGEGEVVTHKVDNTSTLDENSNVKFLTAEGKIALPAKKGNGALIGTICGVAGAAVVAGVVAGVVVTKKKKKQA